MVKFVFEEPAYLGLSALFIDYNDNNKA